MTKPEKTERQKNVRQTNETNIFNRNYLTFNLPQGSLVTIDPLYSVGSDCPILFAADTRNT